MLLELLYIVHVRGVCERSAELLHARAAPVAGVIIPIAISAVKITLLYIAVNGCALLSEQATFGEECAHGVVVVPVRCEQVLT